MLKYLWDQRDYKNRKWELLLCFIFSRGKLIKLFIEEKKLDREIDGMIKKFRAHVNGKIAKVK
jgi:hypothetical protein